MSKSLLLLAHGFEGLEASSYTDVLGWNNMEGDGTTDLDIVALRPEIEATWNYHLKIDHLLSEINLDDYDALLIPGGFEERNFYEDGFSKEFVETINWFFGQGKLISSICVAALTLGNAGILKGLNATTYNSEGSIRQSQLADFGAKVIQEPIVIDHNVITSWNPSTAVPVGLKTLELLTSPQNAAKVAKLMGY